MAAYTGFIRTTSGASTETGPPDSNLDFSRISEVYNRKFLSHAVDNTIWNELTDQYELPRNAGTQTMRFFRRGVANVDNVRTLTEGTPISSFTLGLLEKVEVTLAQYGDAAKISDTRMATDLIKQLDLETERMGEETALYKDTEIRDAAYSGINTAAQAAETAAAGGHKDYVINRIAASTDVLEVGDLDRAATLLTERRTPMFDGGHYVAVLSPRQAYMLRRDSLWQDVAKYSDKEKIYKGEIGKMFNVKVIVSTNPRTDSNANIDFDFDGTVLDTVDGTTETAHGLGTIEQGFVFGKGFMGTCKLAGDNSPLSPSLIINNKADKSDPLNQFLTVGYKFYSASVCLNADYGVMLQSPTASLAVY